MCKKKNVIGIVAAGGIGKRLGSNTPKQFLEIEGKQIIIKSMEPFFNNERIKKVYLIVPKGYEDYCREIISEYLPHGTKNFVHILAGGSERQDSIFEGIRLIKKEEQNYDDLIILVHDGARPFASDDLVSRIIKGAEELGAVIPILPITDTIRIRKENSIEVIDRDKLMIAQTPQGFRGSILINSYEKAMEERYYGTDDGQLVQWAGFELKTVEGEQNNKKITVIEDLPDMLQPKDFPRIGSGYDVHRLVDNRKLVLGGVTIPFHKGLDGHSDADVLIHAIMDAILGGAALGDIGRHFPPTEMKYKDISSLKLLEMVNQIVKEKGYILGNIDATIICEEPKIKAYVDEMKNNIAKALETTEEMISIKGTTTEKLGFTGRKEGIAAEAVCFLMRKNK